MTDWTKPDADAMDHRMELGNELSAHAASRRAARLIARERAVHGAVPMDDVEWLLECHPLMTAKQMAPRFEISANGLYAAIKRAERWDLLAILDRNVELATGRPAARRAS